MISTRKWIEKRPNKALFILFLTTKAQAEQKWKSKLPQWNTGRLYMATYNLYHTTSYGLVCRGNRQFIIDQTFGRLVCKDNGFKQLDYIGLRRGYLDFIKANYDNVTSDYFESIYPEYSSMDSNGCLPDFAVAGAECDEQASELNDCKINSFDDFGGNCMKRYSTVFVHCSQYEEIVSLQNGIMETDSNEYEEQCFVDNAILVTNRYCIAHSSISSDDISLPSIEKIEDHVICPNEPMLDAFICKIEYEPNSDEYNEEYYTSEDEYYAYDYLYDDTDSTEPPSPEKKECILDETRINPKSYCPKEWNCELQEQHCYSTMPDCISGTQVASIGMTAIVLIVVLLVIVLLFVYGRNKWRNREHGESIDLKSIRANEINRKESKSSQRPLLDDSTVA